MRLTSDVKKKEPVDELRVAAPAQRVWAHVAVRNRGGEARRITAVFSVGGEERSSVDLVVEPSWSFRTWGYVTLRASDRSGELEVEIRDDESALLGQARIPIRPTATAAPR